MYPRFIELHWHEIPASVNVDNIGIIKDHEFLDASGHEFQVDESYEDIKAMIQSAGCAIQKGDPRLDTSKPVAWDELTKPDMIGEPLFNSNSRKWMLLIDSASDNSWVDLVNTSGGTERWIEHDVQKYPLYRMGERK